LLPADQLEKLFNDMRILTPDWLGQVLHINPLIGVGAGIMHCSKYPLSALCVKYFQERLSCRS
jgi:hypothetical protein